MLFKRRSKPRPGLTRGQAYDARPIGIDTLGRKPLPRGGKRLVVPFRPRGYQRWLMRVPADATRQVDLDAPGLEVFDMCDGKNTVRRIVKKFARHHKMDEHEAEVAVVAFIRSMIKRGLVYVAVEKR